MTTPDPTKRYNRNRGYTCPKCLTDNFHGNRKVQYFPAWTEVVNQNTINHPDRVAMYCFYCGYQIGQFAPSDNRDLPLDNNGGGTP